MSLRNLVKATDEAVYAVLAASTNPAAAPAYQHVKQGTQPPFNKVGQIDTDNMTGKSGQLEKLTIEIHSVFRGEERGPLLDQMFAVREAFDQESATTPLSADGVEFGEVNFVSSTASDASVLDGVTYVGVTVIEIYAEPA
jgi:hypothetical protein